jgi:hypothetical protein
VHYIAILSPRSPGEAAAVLDEVGELVSRFLGDHPDHEDTFAEPGLEDCRVYVEQALTRNELPQIEERLRSARSALCFEGPADPQESPAQVSVLKLFLQKLEGSVIDWGGIDYGWPMIQLSEEGLATLERLPDEARIERPED